MTYEELLGKQPLSTEAGDLYRAGKFLEDIQAYMGTGEHLKQLAAHQQSYLYRLRKRWEVRAAGKDAGWNEHGSRPGRRRTPGSIKAPKKGDIDRTAYGEEDELDPLLASILRKYGTPTK